MKLCPHCKEPLSYPKGRIKYKPVADPYGEIKYIVKYHADCLIAEAVTERLKGGPSPLFADFDSITEQLIRDY